MKLFAVLSLLLTAHLGAQDLYLIIGQSNAAGRGRLPDPLETVAQVQVLDAQGSFVAADLDTNKFSTVKKPGFSGASFALSFGQAMHAATGQEIRLVVNARGGSSIKQWKPSADPQQPSLYDEAVLRLKLALEKAPDSTLKGILWHQGESNRNLESYPEHLAELIAQLREEFGVVPFIAGEISHEREDNAPFNANLKAITTIPAVDYVSAEGLATSDKTHFTTEAQQQLGLRYAEKMQAQQKPATKQ